MKPESKRLMWLLVPLALTVLAVCGLLFHDVLGTALRIPEGFIWLPLIFCIVVIVCSLFLTGFLLYINHQNRLRLESDRENLRRSEELYRVFEDFSDAVVFEADPQTDVIRFNPKFAEMFGHPPDSQSLERNMAALARHVAEADRPAFETFLNAYRNRTSSSVCEFRIVDDGDSGIWHRLEYRLLLDGDAKVYRLVGKLTNIDRDKRSFQRLRTQAESDSLTGLFNHEAAHQHIDHILVHEGYAGNHALLVIDVDNFKSVNDDFGHPEGDRLLKKLAETIRDQFRASDIVGRIGGDEFIVFVAFSATDALLRAKAGELNETLQYVCVSERQERTVTCSVGISLTHGRPMSFDALFREADAALYRTKAAGKNGFQFFDSGTDEPLPQEATDSMAGGAAGASIQLRALLEYMEGGVLLYEIGEEIRVIYTSPSYYHMIGRQPQRQASAVLLHQYVHREDEPQLSAALRAGAETGEVVDTVYRVTSEAGAFRWRHIRAVRVPYEESRCPVLIAVVTDVTALKEQEKRLLDNEQLLKLALEQTDLRIWTYDLKKNELSGPKLKSAYRDLPESNIENGLTHPESAEAYREFYRRIKAGEPFGSCVVRQCLFGPQYDWLRLSYRNLYDENGVPYQAIGVTEPLPGVETAKERFEREEQFYNSIADSFLVIMRYNLTRDVMEKCWLADPAFWGNIDPYAPHALLSAMTDRALTAQDKRMVSEQLSTKRQQSVYESGEESETLELRLVGADGGIRWVSCQNYYLPEPISGDVYVLSVTRDIELRRRWELALPQHIEREPATGLYTRRIAEALIKRILRMEKRKASCCAMLLLSVGRGAADEGAARRVQERVVTELGRRLYIAFDGSFVAGRQDSDTFLLFTPDAGSELQAKQLSGRVLDVVNGDYIRLLHRGALHCRLGTAFGSTDRYSYDMLLSACEAAMTETAGEERREGLAQLTHSVTADGRWSAVPLGGHAGERTQEEERLVLNCAMSAVHSEQPEDALPDLLSAIGQYFGAVRAFFLLYHEDGHSVDALCEWFVPEQERILSGFRNRSVTELPVVERALEQKTAVLYSDPAAEKRYLCVPASGESGVYGFICLEAPARGLEDVGLIETVAGLYMARVVRRERHMSAAIHADRLTGLEDYGGYRSYVEETDAEMFSSLGAVCLDVNGLDALNREFGKQYGDKLLQFIAQTLRSVFFGHEAFRMSGDEFLVLATNLTQEAFMRLVTEMVRRCEAAFPGVVCLGYTWSDERLSFVKQTEHAESRLKLAKQPYYRRTEQEGGRMRPASLEHLERNIENGRFRLYLQPKVELATGVCTGAEALVRFYDPEQDLIVTPDMFVPQLENDSIIPTLDLHVFELALGLMKRWQSEGRKLLPLSVNFSRLTALDAGTPARMKELQTAGGVRAELMEIELTERIGSLERATVTEACRAISDMGYRLALDDFGSEYSSLSILPIVRFDTLKLDRSIVADLASNRMGSLIIENSVRLCLEMGVDCVAEGVETPEQAELLKNLGCRYAQGYYYDKPMPAEQFAEKYLPVSAPAEREG